MALARAVGVKAFYVHLEEDYSGEIVYHDCAAVFVGGKALLVDPAYQWFGAPHKQYVVLDDLQAIAHQYYQPSPKGGPGGALPAGGQAASRHGLGAIAPGRRPDQREASSPTPARR